MEKPHLQPPSAHDLFGYAVHQTLRALSCAIDGLLGEASEVQKLAAKVEPQLRMLTMEWDS